MSSKEVTVCGFDPSLRNWGIAVGRYNISNKQITIKHVSVVCPVLSTGKKVRQNRLDIESAIQLYSDAVTAAVDAHIVFVEVPVGSQSARASVSYGICVGILGAMVSSGFSVVELTPAAIKLAGVGSEVATKKEMIEWAVAKHPEANWPTRKVNGQVVVCEGKAEHMADAVAAIYAGISSEQFKQVLLRLEANQKECI